MKTKLLKIVLLAALVFVIWRLAYRRIEHAVTCDDRRAHDHYTEARAFKQRGQLPAAAAALTRAMNTACSTTCAEERALGDLPLVRGVNCWIAEYRRALGFHHSATRNYSACVRWYQAASDLDPQLVGPMLMPVAWCHMQAGDAAAAKAAMDRKRAEYQPFYGPKDAAFHRSVADEVALTTGSGRVNVRFEYTPSREVASLGELANVQIRGNWNRDGKRDDAYGYAPVPMRREGAKLTARVELDRVSVLPYQAVITASVAGAMTTVGFSRFRLTTEGASQFVTVKSSTTTAFFALSKRSRLRRRLPSADGRRRMFVLWPDGGSWWLLRSLMERGLAPNALDMYRRGAHGVMISEPPITSIAMQRLTSFKAEPSWWDALWLQIKGLQSLDEYVEIEQGGTDSLASRLATHDVTFVDLVFNEPFAQSSTDQASKLGFDPSQHLYKFSPTSKIDPDSLVHDWLDLSRVDSLLGEGQFHQKWGLATQWDDAEDKLTRGLRFFTAADGPDAMLLRIPAVDVLSHAFFDNTDRYSESTGVMDLG